MNRRTLLLSAGAAAIAACASPAEREFSLASDVDAALARAMALGAAPGLSVAVYSREGVYTRGLGVTDVETSEPVTADTAFYIASSTKPLTALAFALLEDRGELDLQQSLAAYAPDAPFPAAVRPSEVKLRDLLTHTHGIENDAIVHRTAFSGEHDPETLWRLLGASTPNQDAPLGRFEYTNVGYNIATILTDRRLGVRWQDLLEREIFAPAGMRRATAIMSRGASWPVARPHRSALTGGARRLYLEKTDQTMQSAGGVIMSANDAVRWLELMVEEGRVGGRQIAPAAVIQATRTPHADVAGEFQGYERAQYALGWYTGAYRGEPMLHHFGGFAGFRAHVSYLPERRIGVAAFVNDGSAAFPLVDAIANYVYDRTAGREDADTAFDEALANVARRREQGAERVHADRANRASREWLLTRPKAAYAGVYENAEYGRIEVSVSGDTLTVRNGVLHAIAEPFTQPDSIRVELIPFTGMPIMFLGDGPAPEALVFERQRFERV